MKHSCKIAVLVMAMASAFPAMAQQADGSWLIRGRALNLDFRNGQADNMQQNLGGAKIEAQNRWIPEIDISYFFTKNIAAELILTYPQDVDINLTAPGLNTRIGTIGALPPTLTLQYHFTDLGAFKPYVGVGVNYTLFSKRSNFTIPGASIDQSSWGLAAQVGFDYALTKNWYLNVDAKYLQMSTDVKVGDTKIGKVNLDPMVYGIGLGYRF